MTFVLNFVVVNLCRRNLTDFWACLVVEGNSVFFGGGIAFSCNLSSVELDLWLIVRTKLFRNMRKAAITLLADINTTIKFHGHAQGANSLSATATMPCRY